MVERYEWEYKKIGKWKLVYKLKVGTQKLKIKRCSQLHKIHYAQFLGPEAEAMGNIFAQKLTLFISQLSQ